MGKNCLKWGWRRKGEGLVWVGGIDGVALSLF